MSAVSELINTLYPDGLPRRLASIVNPDLTQESLVAFKLNPVLNSEATRTTRLAVVCTTNRNEWAQRVSKAWNNSAIATFWQSAPAHTRQMIDTDGGRTFVVYNDDLQPPPGALLAMTLALPKIGPGLLIRTPLPPQTLPFLPDVSGLQALGGQWALRTEQNRTTGVLWVSESRWKGNAEESTRAVFALPCAAGWMPRWSQIQTANFTIYPDAIEFREDGTVDLTVGFL